MSVQSLIERREKIIERIKSAKEEKEKIEQEIAEAAAEYKIGDRVFGRGSQGREYIIVGFVFLPYSPYSQPIGARIKKDGTPYNEANRLWL